MKGLKCTTDNCEFNKACHCMAGIINVTKTGRCASKIKRSNGVLEQEFSNMEAAEEFDYAKSEDLLIECSSDNCYYNSKGLCSSPIVNVADGVFKTKCYTRCNGSNYEFN